MSSVAVVYAGNVHGDQRAGLAAQDASQVGQLPDGGGLAGRARELATGRHLWLALHVSEMKVQSKAMNERAYQSASGDPAALSLSADTIFNEAYSDLVQGNFDLAIEGFSAFFKNFPSIERADDAQYNIGEAYYNSRKLQQAIAAFTRVIDDYPNADKVASAYFKRRKAEVALGENENAIEDFKLIVQKYPAAAEASLAKTELENLGVNLSRQTKPAKPLQRQPGSPQ